MLFRARSVSSSSSGSSSSQSGSSDETNTGNPDDSTTFGNAFAMGLEVCMYLCGTHVREYKFLGHVRTYIGLSNIVSILSKTCQLCIIMSIEVYCYQGGLSIG